MERYPCILSITSLVESQDFIRKYCNVNNTENFLNELLRSWLYKWNDFDEIATDIHEKTKSAIKILLKNCQNTNCSGALQVSLECVILNKLHDDVLPLLCYAHAEEDALFYEKCNKLCDLNITAEQLGAPEDYAIPLAAAVVEFASLDARKSPVEKVHCLCTTYDLIFAELKTAIIEIISKTSDEIQIPVIENHDVVPILMIVIVKSKLLHLSTNMYYIDRFLWKLHESSHVQNTISVFKNAIAQIRLLREDNIGPSSSKIHKDMDLSKVTSIMSEVKVTPEEQQTQSLLDNHIKRLNNLIFASTNQAHF